MIRISVVIWILVLALLGIGLFQVKYNVQAKEAELRGIKRQIDSNLSTIHVLEAEWSYLNDPVRLADLARRHTDLLPTQANQIKTLADLPLRPVTAPAPQQNPANPGASPTVPLLSNTQPQLQLNQPAQAGTTTAAASAQKPASAPAANAATGIIPAAARVDKPQDKPVATAVSAKPVATPAANPAAKQPVAADQQPGSDETIDAILADMQRAQGTSGASPAGDQ